MVAGDERWAAGSTLLASAWRYRVVIVVLVIFATGSVFLLSSRRAPVYQASTLLLLRDPASTPVRLSARPPDFERYLPQQAARVTSTPVMTRALDLLDDPPSSPESLRGRVRVETDEDIGALIVHVVSSDPQRAADLANAVGQAYGEAVASTRLATARGVIDEIQQEIDALEEDLEALRRRAAEDPSAQLDRTIDVLTRERTELGARIRERELAARVGGTGVERRELAVPPQFPIAPRPKRTALLAAVFLAGLAVAAAYARAGHDQGRRGLAAQVLGAPRLATLSEPPLPLTARGWGRGGIDDDQIGLAVEAIVRRPEISVIAVVGLDDGALRSAVAADLAYAAGQLGSVVLVDADVRARTLTRTYHAEGREGLLDVGRRWWTDLLTPIGPLVDHAPDIPFLPAGDPGAGYERLREPAVMAALRELELTHDLVVLDVGPPDAVSDLLLLADRVDGVVVVADEAAPTAPLEQVAYRVRFLGLPILGVVVLAARPAGSPLPTRPAWTRKGGGSRVG